MQLKSIFAAFLGLSMSAGVASAEPPAFLHWYHAYSQPVQTCGALIKETMQNIHKNWDLDKSNIKATSSSFVSGDTRGFLRCLQRGANSSWVVIITAGGGSKAKTMFNDMKVVVCGDC